MGAEHPLSLSNKEQRWEKNRSGLRRASQQTLLMAHCTY